MDFARSHSPSPIAVIELEWKIIWNPMSHSKTIGSRKQLTRDVNFLINPRVLYGNFLVHGFPKTPLSKPCLELL
jgi:hypothetical protein